MSIELKIGRHIYKVTDQDKFMDNGKIVQLLTQSKERPYWGRQPNPVLSKRAIKQIAAFERMQVKDHSYCAEVFSLGI